MTTKILMINTFTGSESPKTGNHTQVLNMANGMNITICRPLSFVWKTIDWHNSDLCNIESWPKGQQCHNDDNCDGTKTSSEWLMMDISQRMRFSLDLDRHTVIIFFQSTYVRISINWKWQQVAPRAHPIEIDTNINIIILRGKIFDTKYIIYEEILWYKGI